MIHVADYYPAYTGALSSYKSSRRHAFCWYSGAVVGLGGHFGSESMSKTRIFITPQLIHSTTLMVLLGYILTTTPPWPLVPPLIPPTITSPPLSIPSPSTLISFSTFHAHACI